MKIVMIAAAAENRVIGAADNSLPWRLPGDLKRFRRLTLDHAVIMGRKTFGTLPGALDRRTNIILTRSGETPKGAYATDDPDEALRLAAEHGPVDAKTVYIVGGSQIYNLYMDRADEIDLTRVHARPEGPTLFPVIDPVHWRLTSADPLGMLEKHSAAFSYERWSRV